MSETQPKMAIRTSSEPLATKYDIMFDRDIEEPSEFHEEFYVMRQMVEGDLCNIHINTCGGCVATISAFQNIKSKSPAHFHGILDGVGYSAGSAFFLLCDTHEVGDFAEMMIHTSQGSGFYSHSQGREEYGKQASRTARIFVESVYQDFLTTEEIEDVLKGAEIWLDASQIRERLEKRAQIREKRLIEEEKQTWTEEVYVQQAVQNILEDCEAFEYNPVQLSAEIFKAIQYIVEDDETTEAINTAYDKMEQGETKFYSSEEAEDIIEDMKKKVATKPYPLIVVREDGLVSVLLGKSLFSVNNST